MARTNKNSRIKGLPPKVQLNEEDSMGRTFSSRKFDDTNTILFQEEQAISYGSKLPASSQKLTTELSTSLTTTGNVISGISDVWLIESGSNTRLTGTVQPFLDSGNPAVDAICTNDPFFTAGSGEGFTQPLWSKTKIEINIPSNPCSFKTVISQSSRTDTNTSTPDGYVSGSSYQMAYYNFDLQVWEGIGTGWPLQGNNITMVSPYGDNLSNKNNSSWRDSMKYGTIGFNAGIVNLRSKIVNQLTSSTAQQVDYANHFLSLAPPQQDIFGQRLAGMPTDSYGFPYAPKFHATSSQVLNMSNYIDRPFLLEKVIVEISGAQFTMFDSVNTGGYYSLTSSVLPATVNNFFILNQRKNSKYSYRPDLYEFCSVVADLKYESPSASVELTAGSYNSQTYVDTTRDLVTFGGITGYTNDLADHTSKNVKFEIHPDLTEYATRVSDVISQVAGAEVGTPLYMLFLTGSTISSITQSYDILSEIQRDSNIYISQSMSSSLSSLGWSENLQLNIPVRSPNSTFVFWGGGSQVEQNGTTTSPVNHGSFTNGTTNGLGFNLLSSRRSRNEFKVGTTLAPDFSLTFYGSSVVYDLCGSCGKSFEFFNAQKPEFFIENPYILFPEDNLVFGWQLPIPQAIADPTGLSIASVENRAHYNSWVSLSVPASGSNRLVDICEMSFNGPGKVTLYGSYMSNGKEVHSTYNPATNSVYEVIG